MHSCIVVCMKNAQQIELNLFNKQISQKLQDEKPESMVSLRLS